MKKDVKYTLFILKKIFILLCVIGCILWIGFIFYNSNNVGNISQKQSKAITRIIKEKTKNIDIVQNTKKYINKDLNALVRKNAHFMEYLILAIFISITFFSFKFKGKKALIYIFFICLFLAVLDEFNQSFVSGRSSTVKDIVIDFSGSVSGTFIYYFIYYVIYNKF
ncbi:VanZ family protein [Clostridium aestuarii]|uniref:VanZ family protein n=1 Tax=Clostridium aestuarii TaxID=338193 RepID=A0ABT4CZI1_9CLOT|nr:VanZ family protein [Clostridium aestuarii]MCY6484389.1 VanZ family protein [Clostridium aestuarii]